MTVLETTIEMAIDASMMRRYDGGNNSRYNDNNNNRKRDRGERKVIQLW